MMDTPDAAVEFLTGAGAGAVHHHGGTLLDHLVGTHRLLRSWGCAPPVCSAGLFHSFYAWLAQPTEKSRAALATAIGRRAEELVHIFGSTPPDDLLAPHWRDRREHVELKTASGITMMSTDIYVDLLWLDRANTEDLLARAFLTPVQHERLQERCIRVEALLATLDPVRSRGHEGERV